MIRVAVVTPYHREADEVLARCCASVGGQTYPCTHILVADGHPRPGLDRRSDVMHVTLPVPTNDHGNTPRGIGSLLAEAYGFDAVAWLDADNWYAPDHLEKLAVAVANCPHAQLVSCRRKFYDWQQNELGITEAYEDEGRHVDTNCWLVLRSAFAMLRFWFLPRAMSAIGDRLFLAKVAHQQLRHVATTERTVCYQTLHASHYIQSGRPPPPHAKQLDFAAIERYVTSAEGRAELTRVLGFQPLIR